MRDKLTIEQHIEVLNKCADSIYSDDGVVQQAIRQSTDVLVKKIKELEEAMLVAKKQRDKLECYMISEGYDFKFIQSIKSINPPKESESKL